MNIIFAYIDLIPFNKLSYLKIIRDVPIPKFEPIPVPIPILNFKAKPIPILNRYRYLDFSVLKFSYIYGVLFYR